MSKAVMLSIQPRWCELIANGDKTIEVRKTRPKLESPFKCYIYQTLPKSGDWNERDGRIIGEFVCDRITRMAQIGYTGIGGKPIYKLADYENWGYPIDPILKEACLRENELETYLQGRVGLGWHISDLKIYDKPRKPDEFERPYECDECTAQWASECNACHKERKIKRPPQSYCFVEALQT